MLFQMWIGTVVDCENHVVAVFNDRVALGDQVEFSTVRVMNADLLRAEVKLAVYRLVNETRCTDATSIYLAVFDVLHIQALYLKWEVDCAVLKVLNNYVFLAFILAFSFPDNNVTEVLDIKIISSYYNSFMLLYFLYRVHMWLCGTCNRLLSCESKLLFW